MESYFLRNFLPELTSNIKITCRDNNVFLNTIVTNNTMIDSKLKEFESKTGSYIKDITEYRKDTEGVEFYSKSTEIAEIPKIDGYVMCPLWMIDVVPDQLIFIKDGRVCNNISLKGDTKIGKYLREHLASIDNIDPIYINKERNLVSIYGIDVKKGSVSTLTYSMVSENINESITRNLKNSNMVIQNLLNLEFQIDPDLDYDECFYCLEKDLFKYLPLTIENNDFLPVNYNKTIPKNEYDITNIMGDGFLFNGSNVAYPYVRDFTGKITNIVPNGENDGFENDILTTIKFFRSSNISAINNSDNKNVVLYRLTEQFEQNDFVDVTNNIKSITLCADELPNYVLQGNEFGFGDHLDYIFNPSGTKYQSIDAFIGSFNETIGSDLYLEAVRVDDMILISGNGGSSSNVKLTHPKLKEITHGVIDQHNTDSFLIPFEDFDDVKDETIFMQNNHGNYKIIGYRPYVIDIKRDEFNENYFNDFNKWYIVTTKNVSGENYFSYIAKPEYPSIGAFDMFDVKAITSSISSSKLVSDDEVESLFKPKNLVLGVKYIVISKDTKISHSGGIYSTNDTFTATTTQYDIISGEGLTLEYVYYNDPVVMQVLDSHYIDINTDSVETSSDMINWYQKHSSDSHGSNINTIKNNTPKGELLPNISGTTNEWYVPSSKPKRIDKTNNYFTEFFDIDTYKTDPEYFFKFVGDNRSIFKTIDDMSPTCVFRGIEYVGQSDMDGYNLSVILNFHDQSDSDFFKDAVSYDVIKNEQNRTAVILLGVAFSDYKLYDQAGKHFYYSMMYFLNDLRKSNSIDDFGLEYTYPYTTSLTTVTEKFRGMRLPLKANSSDGNGILFNNNIQLSTLIVPNQYGFIKVVCMNTNTKTIISTEGLYGGGQQRKIVSLNNQTMNTNDGKVWVSCLNGINIMGEMDILDINNFVDWSTMEFYLLDGGFNGYLLQQQMLSFSFMKDAINNNRDSIIKSIIDETGSLYKNLKYDNILGVTGNESDIFSGFYSLNVKTMKSFVGDNINNNWNYGSDDVWSNLNEAWNDIPDETDLKLAENINL
jgi:hypothetical protein